jgi:hypothetical protein
MPSLIALRVVFILKSLVIVTFWVIVTNTMTLIAAFMVRSETIVEARGSGIITRSPIVKQKF